MPQPLRRKICPGLGYRSPWAARNIRLSSVDSAEFGLYNPGRAPYQREILDCFSDDSVQRVVFQASAQVGKTLLELLALAYVAVNRPGGVLYCLPGKETCEKISKDRLQPLLDANSALAGRFVEVKSRDSGNTIARKSFVGGYVQFATLNSPAALASSPMPVILFDEVDRSDGVNEEGDAVSQAEKRTATFWNRKIFMISTPRDLETSVIHREFLLGDQRHFLVPCPMCGERHRLTWGGIKFVVGDDDLLVENSVRHVCPACQAEVGPEHKEAMVGKGQWVPTAVAKRNMTRSYHINQLYSPFVSWADTVREFLEAKRSPAKLTVFVNTALGEPWEQRFETNEELEEKVVALSSRCEGYDAAVEVPSPVRIITAGIDVQSNRIELETVGWGKDGQSWSLDLRVFEGDLATAGPWNELDRFLLGREYRTGDERVLPIAGAAIDTGGHFTSQTYAYLRQRRGRTIFGIKGWSVGQQKELVFAKSKVKTANVWLLDVRSGKDTLFGNLELGLDPATGKPPPNYCHFPARPKEYFDQLYSEKLVQRFERGQLVRRWEKVKPSARNEALDCRVYAMSVLDIMKVRLDTLPLGPAGRAGGRAESAELAKAAELAESAEGKQGDVLGRILAARRRGGGSSGRGNWSFSG
ncbi:terminase, large subunit [Gammaproteobacteria bacterium]